MPQTQMDDEQIIREMVVEAVRRLNAGDMSAIRDCRFAVGRPVSSEMCASRPDSSPTNWTLIPPRRPQRRRLDWLATAITSISLPTS